MYSAKRPSPEEVEQLLLNADLRNDLEPFLDDSVDWLNMAAVPTIVENEYLSAMLAWERAPVVPISHWFEPEMTLAPPDSLSDEELHQVLWTTIHRLFQKRIVLDFTDHLNDRQLYELIYRDILPAKEKKIDYGTNYLHWDCADSGNNPDTWLRYYASPEERKVWCRDLNTPIPKSEPPPFPRELPRHPL